MPYQIEWIVQDHLIGVYLKGLVTPAEVGEIAKQTYDMMVEREQYSVDLIHLIVDSTSATMSPLMRDYSRIPMKRSNNMGWTVVTGTTGLMRMIISIFAALLPGVQFTSLSTVKEAIEFLGKRDFAIEAYVQQNQPYFE